MDNTEAVARYIAARKMALVKDPYGTGLPDEFWHRYRDRATEVLGAVFGDREEAFDLVDMFGFDSLSAGRRWRHVKRGTTYTEIGRAELQMSRDLVEGAFLVIYWGDDGKLLARQEDEFEDGRFEEVT